MLKKIMKFIYHKYDDGLYCIYKIFGIKIITKPLRLQINSIHENINQRIDILEKSMKDEVFNIKSEMWNVSANIKNEMWSVAANVNENSWNVGGNVKNELWATTKNIKDNTQNGFNTFALYLPQIMKSVDYSAIIGSIPCVSVIVIVYNLGEKYIRPCLESVVNQTLKNIEIIIVNDASPHIEDDLICREYASKDKRIKYIVHKENTGAGGARMTGIKQATGHSIAFVDGDDYLSLNCYEIVFSQLISSNVDIVSFGYYDFEDTHNISKKYLTDCSPAFVNNFFGDDIINYFLSTSLPHNIYYSTIMWNKLYTAKLIKSIGDDFIPIKYRAQDVAAMFKIYYKIKSILNITTPLYYHRWIPNLPNREKKKYNEDYIKNLSFIFMDMKKFLDKENIKTNENNLFNFFYSLCRIYWCYNNSYNIRDFNIDKIILKECILDDFISFSFNKQLVYNFLKDPVFANAELLEWYEKEILGNLENEE